MRSPLQTIFVMPSSSARCAQLPRAEDKLPFFVALRKLRDFLRGELSELADSDVVFADYTEFRVTQPDPKSLRKAERRRKRKAEAAAAAAAAAASTCGGVTVSSAPDGTLMANGTILSPGHQLVVDPITGLISNTMTNGTETKSKG
ncbi:unnamed protein product [Dicrocoelium dendriticum]|nr:unnamed protein product [Dicrocoelium dendriticum]